MGLVYIQYYLQIYIDLIPNYPNVDLTMTIPKASSFPKCGFFLGGSFITETFRFHRFCHFHESSTQIIHDLTLNGSVVGEPPTTGLISGKSRLVKYCNLARITGKMLVPLMINPIKINSLGMLGWGLLNIMTGQPTPPNVPPQK